MEIRLAQPKDTDRLMEIFAHARQFMQQTGNARQWINNYPQRSLIENDIEMGHCYVCLHQGGIVATFCFIEGPDPTYSLIEDGQWLFHDPYHVIHRIASDGSMKGIVRQIIDWCSKHSQSLRADTHEDNKIMQHLLLSNGFTRCGIIYVANGTPRIAYQR